MSEIFEDYLQSSLWKQVALIKGVLNMSVKAATEGVGFLGKDQQIQDRVKFYAFLKLTDKSFETFNRVFVEALEHVLGAQVRPHLYSLYFPSFRCFT